ncbi:MAG: cytochrome c [Myxococcales bacterium]|nr:cytochrome c [Myxococcales bacterium]
MLLLLAACAHQPDPVTGAQKYDLFCSSCHGADGTAGVQVDGVAATDLATSVGTLTDEVLTSVMVDGVGTMPPQRLDDDEAADVVAYLRLAFED